MLLEVNLMNSENFLKIRETLTRMGIASNTDKKLYQSCHILQKQGKYYIVHFKEMLKLDGRKVNLTQEDLLRRNSIAKRLEDWGMCTIVQPEKFVFSDESHYRVIGFSDKHNWTLVHKYKIGK